MSSESPPKIVRPHAPNSLWPIEMPGNAGSPPPITFQPGATRCTQYRNEGASCTRCGSFIIIGRPLDVSLPLTTQLLLPTSSGRSLNSVTLGGSNPAREFDSLRYSATSSSGVNLIGSRKAL